MPQINALGLEGFTFKDINLTNSFYYLPKNQCILCGKIDQDDFGNKFNNKSKFCHFGCSNGDPNPSAHKEGCCYRAWRMQAKNLKQKFKRIIKKDEILSNEQKKRIIEPFIEFCETRCIENQKIKYPPRGPSNEELED